jgi:hypothetical protein
MHRKTSRNHYAITLLLLTSIHAGKNIYAQFDIEDSNTTASLRGIHNVGGGVAWASGTNGTVLRSEDGGYLWQTCTIPPGAEKLDFRGIQAFDENTAIVMSSGKGDLSRLYKTTDGCQTWHLLFTNPDKEGFWDALWAFHKSSRSIFIPDSPDWIEWADTAAAILGDPVNGRFALWGFNPSETGDHLVPKEWNHRPHSEKKESAFAASNSALFKGVCATWIATGGEKGSRILEHVGGFSAFDTAIDKFRPVSVPVGNRSASSGVFSFALLPDSPRKGFETCDKVGVAVGGDYLKPDDTNRTAAFTLDGGQHWLAPQTPPHGYRSSVAYDPQQKLWITVGPNGTDISIDDGKNWHPLTPSGYDPPDADKNWNALSLPFVVGPHGRIGRLRTINQKPEHPK